MSLRTVVTLMIVAMLGLVGLNSGTVTHAQSPTPDVLPTPPPLGTSAATPLPGTPYPTQTVTSTAMSCPRTSSSTPLRLTKAVSPALVEPGSTVAYTLTLCNGGETARTVAVRDTLDTRQAIVGVFAPNEVICTIDGQTVACTLTLAARATHSIIIQARVLPSTATGEQIPNVASADPGGTSATVIVRVVAVTTPSPSVSPLPPGSVTPPPTPPALDCAPWPLTPLDVRAPDPRLIAPAAASFQTVRQEILARTGQDVLAVLADVLRHPAFKSGKAGVLNTSWHKAGRAIDLNQGGPFRRVPDGSMFRLYVGTVDITAIFEAHGWNRIPVQGNTLEWWHYEWHPDGIAWTSAMVQVWPLEVLQAAFPDIDWISVGCAAEGGILPPPGEIEGDGCVPGGPNWTESTGVGYSQGCGPPVEISTTLRHFVGVVGWIGESGRLIPPGPSGSHLHLGLDVGTTVDVCRWPFQPPGIPIGQPPPGGEVCLTTWADPLQFLPQANVDSLAIHDGTPVPVPAGEVGDPTLDGAPFQLPPPGHPAGMRFSLPQNDRPAGSWWSPGNDDRATNTGCPLGGPTVTNWLLAVLRWLFPWWFGC